MSIEDTEAFWKNLEQSSEKLKFTFGTRPVEQLSVPKVFAVPNRK